MYPMGLSMNSLTPKIFLSYFISFHY